jgi:hypothetical protein
MTHRSQQKNRNQRCAGAVILFAFLMVFLPNEALAIQLHAHGGGIITHQIGHLFFLFSMVVLVFTIREKKLDALKGWRLIQYSAFFFILWNLDTLTAHFLDNQINVVEMKTLSFSHVMIETQSRSTVLQWVYYVLKLDHLLCVPAMLLLYLGVSSLVRSYPSTGGDEA